MFTNLFKRATFATKKEQALRLIKQGNRLEDSGELLQASDYYRRAAKSSPNLPAAHLNLGIVLAAMGDAEGATRAYQAVLALESGHPFGNYNFANLAYAQGDLARAESMVRLALQFKPDMVLAHVLLSNLLDDSGQTDAAIVAVRDAIRLQPKHLGAQNNLVALLRKALRFEEASDVIDGILLADPENAQAHGLRAFVLQDQGLMLESLQALQQSLQLDAMRFDLRSRELFALNYDEEIDVRDLFRRHVEFGADMEAAVAARFAGAHRGSLKPQRRLRLGYVSGDLRLHPVAMFLLPLLERHDRAAFEVVCYSCDSREDHITARLRESSDRWIEAHGMSEPQLARQIYDDTVDILIDLSGHSGTVRLAVFSEKPAPIQMTWLGYLNTTGLTRMDYRLCGTLSDPRAAEDLHTETLLRLNSTSWCYRPFLDVAYEPLLPARLNGHVTFGSFNDITKISTRMCERWARILLRVPGSQLLICDIRPGPKLGQIQQIMERAGVAADRLCFEPRAEVDRYYTIFHRVDVALDSYPYGGGTTTLDSLWMGVPVVAAVGPLPVSRSASSILKCLGLDGWVAGSIDDYEDLAVAWACNLTAVAKLRAELRSRLAASRLMDEARFTTDVESLLRAAWKRHCAEAGEGQLSS